jgi:regulator of nucleoside diphosphate kinase
MSTAPRIIVSSLDAERLEKLIEKLPSAEFPANAALEAELVRAEIREPAEMPANVVTMNSTVRFRVLSTDESFSRTLVYPKDMDGSEEKISILAPVGSALLGLSEGDEIEWPGPGGAMLKLRIEEVTWQPERAGQLHR